ncbi:MAG: hypothetical protein ABIW76_13055 [Fibrobacteria bacterium]
MRISVSISFPASVFSALLLCGCIFDGKQANKGSVVENEVLAGMLFASDGGPAAHAEVKLYPVAYAPNNGLLKTSADTGLVFTFRTDENGRYVAEGVTPGQYNVLGQSDGDYSYLDSITVNGEPGEIPADTLDRPGSITATVIVEPNHDPRTVFLQVLGTNRFASADFEGRLLLNSMAQGSYAFRVVTTLPNYAPYFGSFRVRRGSSDTLAAPIKLIYTGIPAIRDLRVDYDTATARVRLTWSPVAYPFLKEYVVYRTDGRALDPSASPLSRVKDAFFVDTLSASALGSWPATGPSKVFEYRVRVRNQSEEEGPYFGSVKAEIVPMAAVKTTVLFQPLGRNDFKGRPGDTIMVEARWANPTREIDSLVWFSRKDGSRLRAIATRGKAGADTLRFALPLVAGQFQIGAFAVDRADDHWVNYFGVEAIQVPPTVNAGKDTTVSLSDSLSLQGRATDSHGLIVGREWNIGPGRSFVGTADGKAGFRVRATPGFDTLLFRATDDDGNTVVDTLIAKVINDIPQVTLTKRSTYLSGVPGYSFEASVVDKGRIVKWEWSVDSGATFQPRSSGDTAFVPALAGGSDLKLVVRATDEDGSVGSGSVRFAVSKWGWMGAAPSRKPVVALDGKLYSGIGYTEPAHVYDPRTGIWSDIATPTRGTYVGVISDKIALFGSQSGRAFIWTNLYDPKSDDWTRIMNVPGRQDIGAVGVASDSTRLLVAGSNEFYEFTTAAQVWTAKPAPPVSSTYPALAICNGKAYIFGSRSEGDMMDNYVFEPGLNAWVKKASLPKYLGRPWAVTLGDAIYVGCNRFMYRYDPALDSWTQKSPSLTDASDQSAAVIGGKIYLLGDEGMQIYNPEWDP